MASDTGKGERKTVKDCPEHGSLPCYTDVQAVLPLMRTHRHRPSPQRVSVQNGSGRGAPSITEASLQNREASEGMREGGGRIDFLISSDGVLRGKRRQRERAEAEAEAIARAASTEAAAEHGAALFGSSERQHQQQRQWKEEEDAKVAERLSVTHESLASFAPFKGDGRRKQSALPLPASEHLSPLGCRDGELSCVSARCVSHSTLL